MFVLDEEKFVLIHIKNKGTVPAKPVMDMWNFIVQACYTTYLQGLYDEPFQMVHGIPAVEAQTFGDLPEGGEWEPYV